MITLAFIRIWSNFSIAKMKKTDIWTKLSIDKMKKIDIYVIQIIYIGYQIGFKNKGYAKIPGALFEVAEVCLKMLLNSG